MRPMGRPEGVVDVEVGDGGKLRCEVRIVLLLLLVEAEVLEQEDVAIRHLRDRGLHIVTDAVIHFGDRAVHELGQPGGNRVQPKGINGFSLRPSQMRAQDDFRPMVHQVRDGGDGGTDAAIVRDLAVLQGDIEVHPAENALAAYLNIFDGLLVHCHLSRQGRSVVRYSTGPSRP